MKEKPIIFKDWEIRAIKENCKSQFRRIVKPQSAILTDALARALGVRPPERENEPVIRPPYGQPGDRLWVRETWRVAACYDDKSGSEIARILSRRNVQYEAAGDRFLHGMAVGRVRSPVTMPRWASRITLEIVSVRVERLQEISDEDAFAEGTPCYVCGRPMDGFSESDCHCFHRKASASDYEMIWEPIHGPESWDANPWVWVYDFKKV